MTRPMKLEAELKKRNLIHYNLPLEEFNGGFVDLLANDPLKAETLAEMQKDRHSYTCYLIFKKDFEEFCDTGSEKVIVPSLGMGLKAATSMMRLAEIWRKVVTEKKAFEAMEAELNAMRSSVEATIVQAREESRRV